MTRMEDTLQALDCLISQFLSLDRSIWSSSDDADAFLEAVDELTSAIHSLENASADQLLLNSSDDLLESCASRLGDEFQHLIEAAGFNTDDGHHIKEGHSDDYNRILVALPVRNLDIVIDALPEGVIFEANRITRRMVAAGFGDKCAEAYASARCNFINESIVRLGVEARLAGKFHSASWDELEAQIKRWIPATRALFHILIPSERLLCDRIFDGFPTYGNLAFATACEPFLQVLSFANIVAASRQNPECLFGMVDMYEAVGGILPVLDDAFNPEIAALRECLGLCIKRIFMLLENLIRRDPSESSVPDGGVHPITRYVMNYLMAACASRHTLEEVMLLEFGSVETSLIDPDRPTSSLAVHIAWIVDVLQTNLESKSTVYNHVPLSCIFLMNNAKYMIKKTDGCELNVLLGEDWTKEMLTKVHHWALEYRRATWGKAVMILEIDRVMGCSANVMMEKLCHFMNFLDAICQVQSRWVLVDKQLGVDLSILVEEFVLPTYWDAVERSRAVDAKRELYMQPQSVKSRIQQLFKAMAR